MLMCFHPHCVKRARQSVNSPSQATEDLNRGLKGGGGETERKPCKRGK